ncbi:MAG: hypothetical protein HFF86_08280 [Oscillibacter sp.]|jgi:hypothetical protein|nr:hypothetical protein [Oscillibacter sp.]
MGLTVGLGVILAFGGAALGKVFFDEGQRLRLRFRRPYTAAFFYLLAVLCGVSAVGGVLLAYAILDAFVL